MVNVSASRIKPDTTERVMREHPFTLVHPALAPGLAQPGHRDGGAISPSRSSSDRAAAR